MGDLASAFRPGVGAAGRAVAAVLLLGACRADGVVYNGHTRGNIQGGNVQVEPQK